MTEEIRALVAGLAANLDEAVAAAAEQEASIEAQTAAQRSNSAAFTGFLEGMRSAPDPFLTGGEGARTQAEGGGVGDAVRASLEASLKLDSRWRAAIQGAEQLLSQVSRQPDAEGALMEIASLVREASAPERLSPPEGARTTLLNMLQEARAAIRPAPLNDEEAPQAMREAWDMAARHWPLLESMTTHRAQAAAAAATRRRDAVQKALDLTRRMISDSVDG